MNNFLKDYQKLNEGTEVPDIFSIWCGVAGISAMLGRNVWIDMGNYTIFPNFYIVLVAGSGHCRKSTAARIIERLLVMAEPSPNLVGDKMSPEALIEAMQKVDVNNQNKFLKKTSEGFIIVDELANFLNKKTYENGLAQLLTTLWDCPDKYIYRTKSRGIEELEKISFGMLAGTTVEFIRRAIPQESVGSGLTSRVVFIYTNQKAAPVSRSVLTDEQKRIRGTIALSLGKISEYEGEVLVDDDAWTKYDEIYNHLYHTSSFYNNSLLRGYASRRHVHMLSLAVCISASELEEPRIRLKLRHIEAAHHLLNDVEKDMPEVLTLIASNDKGDVRHEILKLIESKGTASRAELLKRMSHRIDSIDLSQIIQTLVQSKQIQVVASGHNISYKIKSL